MLTAIMTYMISLIPADAKVSTWPLDGLHGELNNIAYMESFYGVYVNHEPHVRGPFHTAFGSLGLKPVTAHMEYTRSPKLQAQFPGLKDQSVFLSEFWHNKDLYVACANYHWYNLRRNTPTLQRAVFGWRWGLTASNNATDDDILNDVYTTKYTTLHERYLNARLSARR